MFLRFHHEAVEPIGSSVEATIEQLLMRVHSAFYVAKEWLEHYFQSQYLIEHQCLIETLAIRVQQPELASGGQWAAHPIEPPDVPVSFVGTLLYLLWWKIEEFEKLCWVIWTVYQVA